MTDYQALYEQKLTTPEEAVKVVKSGDWIDYGCGGDVPVLLDRALAKRADELDDVNIRGLLVYHPLEIFRANDRIGRNVFTFNSWHFGGEERTFSKKGYAFYIPFRYSEVPAMYRSEDDIPVVDVLFTQATKMDKHGYFNLGVSNSHIMEIVRRAKHVVIEENPNLPYIYDLYDGNIHISQVDAIVQSNEKADTIGSPKTSEVDQKIAEMILPHIVNGATLQLGIGGMPNAVGAMIAKSDLKHLGVHTEMYVDSMMEMTKAGVVDGLAKSRDKGKQVYGFAVGSQELYDFMDYNPQFASAPTDYVNSPEIISSFDNFISINNAINIDFYGAVNGESAGFRQISGTGGQLDFVMGAYKSRGGKSFIALSSTFVDKAGNVQSRILPTLDRGSTVTDPRTATHYVATEYGMFNCKGKSLWQRAEGLINLAHPDFRDELIKAAQSQGIWRESSKRRD